MRLPNALLPKKSLQEYLAQYAAEHTQRGTKLTHMVGIPMIVASLPAAVVAPPLGAALFTGGWALQFIGHAVYEKQKPSFFADPFYLLVGPVWVAAEWLELFGLPVPELLKVAAPDLQATANDPPRPVQTDGSEAAAHA